jgi:hypothetical protein
MLMVAVADVNESQNRIVELGNITCVKHWQVKIIFLRRLK